MAMEATEYAFPFDAEECEEGYDREYIAEDFARYFRAFITSGIIADGGNIADNLQVVASDDMTTTLKKGNLMIDGYRYELMEDMIFHHTAADGVLDRIDRVSVTLDTAAREIHAIVREGEYSYKPVAPQCRRTSEYLDYVVADVRVVAGAIKITQANITDTRLSTELCGIAFPFWKLDTQPFFAQLNSFYKEFVAKSDSSYKQFQDWQADKKSEIEDWQASETEETDNWQAEKRAEIDAWKAAEAKQTDDWQQRETTEFNEWADRFISEWENWMNGKIAGWSEEILDWFNNLREQLTDNAEVHLQEQIGVLDNLQTDEKGNLVAAINNVLSKVTSKISETFEKAVKKTGDTMTGALNFANNKWNAVGDDVFIGDRNVAGCLCIKGTTSEKTGIAFWNKNETARRKMELANGDRFEFDCGIKIEEQNGASSLGGTYCRTYRADTGYGVNFGVGSSGINRGVYDTKASEWMIYRDGNNATHIGNNVDFSKDGNTNFRKEVTAQKYRGNGDEIEVKILRDTETRKLSYLAKAAFSAWLDDMHGQLEGLGVEFCVRDGNSVDVRFPYCGGSNVGTGQWILFLKVLNIRDNKMFGATLRLISTPGMTFDAYGNDNPTGNVNMVNLGGTSNTGYTLTAGVEKVTVKASAGKVLRGGICPLASSDGLMM